MAGPVTGLGAISAHVAKLATIITLSPLAQLQSCAAGETAINLVFERSFLVWELTFWS